MKKLHLVAWILVMIGGLNWLLVGLGVGDVIYMIFGSSMLATIIYLLVGLSAIYEIVTHKANCKVCSSMSSSSSGSMASPTMPR